MQSEQFPDEALAQKHQKHAFQYSFANSTMAEQMSIRKSTGSAYACLSPPLMTFQLLISQQ
jgi:hypothetical protein